MNITNPPEWTCYLTKDEYAALIRRKMRLRTMRRLAVAIPHRMHELGEPDTPTAESILLDMGGAAKTDDQILCEIADVCDDVLAEHAAQAPVEPAPPAPPAVAAWSEIAIKMIANGLPTYHTDRRVCWGATFHMFVLRDATAHRGKRAKSWAGYGPKPHTFRARYRTACQRGYGEKVLEMVPRLGLTLEQGRQLVATCVAMAHEGARLRKLPSYDPNT